MQDSNHIALQEHVLFAIGSLLISLQLAKHFGDLDRGSTPEHL